MKAKDLSLGTLFVFIDEKEEARLFITADNDEAHPEQVRAKQVVTINPKREIVKLSLGTTGFKLEDKVYSFNNSGC